MHTFRYNPIFRQWVLLGTPAPRELELPRGSILRDAAVGEFVVAAHPHAPFLMDADPTEAAAGDLLYRESAPVGEYEILLHTGHQGMQEWGIHAWDDWLHLLQNRLRLLHHNLQLHHVMIAFHQSGIGTLGPAYQRVGELIATSHPVAGAVPMLTNELVEKLRVKERGYILHDGEDGLVYAPSAPLYEKEVWYIPAARDAHLEHASAAVRRHAAEALALLMRGLTQEWPRERFVIEVHTALGERDAESTWSLRIYQEGRRMPATLTVLPLPEKFVRDLTYLLGPGRQL